MTGTMFLTNCCSYNNCCSYGGTTEYHSLQQDRNVGKKVGLLFLLSATSVPFKFLSALQESLLTRSAKVQADCQQALRMMITQSELKTTFPGICLGPVKFFSTSLRGCRLCALMREDLISTVSYYVGFCGIR